jgi:hypothetical protein
LAEGVTVIVAITGDAVALLAVNEPITLPAPLAASPILGVLLDQVNVVPLTPLLNVNAD